MTSVFLVEDHVEINSIYLCEPTSTSCYKRQLYYSYIIEKPLVNVCFMREIVVCHVVETMWPF